MKSINSLIRLMTEIKMLSSTTRKLFGFIYIGIIIGFLSGLAISVFQIFNNGYLYYRLYNLMLFDLQHYLTKYSLIFILIASVSIFSILLLKYVHNRIVLKHPVAKNILSNDIVRASIISLIYFLVITIIFWLYYAEIKFYINKGPESDFFERFNIAGKGIYLSLFGVFSIVFSVLAIYATSKYNIIQKALRIMNCRPVRTTAILLFGLVMILNLFIFGYKRFNAPRGMNVLLISIDTLRADHLGSYGYYRV